MLEDKDELEVLAEPAPISQRDAILVSDADTPMGEQILLQLILARWAVSSSLPL